MNAGRLAHWGLALTCGLSAPGLAETTEFADPRHGEVVTASGTVAWDYDAARDGFSLSVKQHRLGALKFIQEVRSVGVFEMKGASEVLLELRGPLTCQFQYVFVTLGSKGNTLTDPFGSCGSGSASRGDDEIIISTSGDCPHITDEAANEACVKAASATFVFKGGRVVRDDP